MMHPTARTALIATAALLLAGAGTAVVAGEQTQRNVQEQLERTRKTLEGSGLATMVSGPYQGNVMGGTQVTKLTLLPKSAEPVVVTLTSRVHNGPFPEGRAFGAATVVTDVTFPPDVQKQLDAALGGQKISITTLVKFGGNSVTTYRVPEGQFTGDGTTMAWKAVTGNVYSEGERVRGDGQWPGLTVRGGGGLITLGASTWSTTGQTAQDGMGNATTTLNVGEIRGSDQGSTVFNVGPVKAESEVKSDAQFVSSSARYHVARATLNGQTYDDMTLNLTMGRLDRQVLAQLGHVDVADQNFDPKTLNSIFNALLQAGPTLSVDRLSVGSGTNEVQLNARAAFKAGADVDWMTLMLDPEALMSQMDVQAHLEGEAQAIEELGTRIAGQRKNVASMLQAAQEEGLLVRKGTRLAADLRLDQDGLKVNGVPLQ
ncbi:DUF945 family protein [Deinococcus aquiradiocola]|nr:DUF945 family protein [Deinococcus aquiradiocola]